MEKGEFSYDFLYYFLNCTFTILKSLDKASLYRKENSGNSNALLEA